MFVDGYWLCKFNTASCVNWLMPDSNNRPYALKKPATFNFCLQVFMCDLFIPPGIKGGHFM